MRVLGRAYAVCVLTVTVAAPVRQRQVQQPWPWTWDTVQPLDYGNNASGWDSAAELRHKARYKMLFTDGQVNHGYDPSKVRVCAVPRRGDMLVWRCALRVARACQGAFWPVGPAPSKRRHRCPG